MTLALISNIANYLKYNYFWDWNGIDNVTLRLWKFSDFCSRHTVGVAGDDIMFHILVFHVFALWQLGHLILCVEIQSTEFDLNFTFNFGRCAVIWARYSCISSYIAKRWRWFIKEPQYTIDAFKSLKILTYFNASGHVNVVFLTNASFHLPGGLIPCYIITSFVYFEFSDYLLLDLQ